MSVDELFTESHVLTETVALQSFSAQIVAKRRGLYLHGSVWKDGPNCFNLNAICFTLEKKIPKSALSHLGALVRASDQSGGTHSWATPRTPGGLGGGCPRRKGGFISVF